MALPELGVAFPESEDFWDLVSVILAANLNQNIQFLESRNPEGLPTPDQRIQGTGGQVDQKPRGQGTGWPRNPGELKPGVWC